MKYSLYSDQITRNVAETVRTVVGVKMLKEGVDPQLATQLKRILSDAFVFYFKAQTFHWNVEGANFPQYHDFFGKIYEGVYANIDRLAEEIRALGPYAPMSLADLLRSTSLMEGMVANRTPADMLAELSADNEKIIGGLQLGFKLAEASNEGGLANFLQDLIDQHKKTAWMINSTAKGA